MKIAVTGGFGFIGFNLVKQLDRLDQPLVLLSNSNHTPPNLSSPVTITPGKVEDLNSLKTAFAGCDILYHLVGIIAETKTKTFESTVAKGTANIVDAAKTCGVKKIIYLSAMGTSVKAPSKYHQSKYQAEQAVINSGLAYTILRPSVVYGQGDGFVSMLVKMIKRSPVLPVIGDGRYQLQPVFIDDLIEAMVQSIDNDKTNNKIIDIGGPEKLEYLQILNILTTVLRKKRMNLHLPYKLMYTIAGLLETVLKPAPLTKDQLIMMRMGNTGDISEMTELFGLQPVRFEDGLKTYMR